MARVVLAVALLGVLGTSVLRSQAALFHPPSPVVVGAGSGNLALLDADRDGDLDLVTVHLLTRRIGIHLGDGRGGFTTSPSSMTLDLPPGAMAHEDVDGDGNADLVVASRDDRREYVSVLRGDGRGRFRMNERERYVVGDAFRFYKPKVVVADVTGDGVADIVSANGRRNVIEILRGDGRGMFSAAGRVLLDPGGDYYSWAVGDADGDGRADLVTTRDEGPATAGRLTVRRGDGQGSFAAAADGGPLGAGPRIAAFADVDGDGKADLVIAHADARRLSILLNTGGAFVPAPRSSIELDREAFAVLVNDLDGDRQADIIAATVNSHAAPYQGGVSVLLGHAHVAAAGSPFGVAPGGYQLAAGDVDRDGKLDVIASSFEGDAVTLLRGR